MPANLTFILPQFRERGNREFSGRISYLSDIRDGRSFRCRLKKSIGAPRREIVTQFLVEAAILSGLGGLIGIGLGFVLSAVLGKLMYDFILLPNALVTVGAAGFSVVIGIVFGIYPAAKASNLQPVDALRAE